MITTLSIICAILFIYIVYQGGKVIKECRNEERFFKDKLNGYPKAYRKPTKSEIAERNHIDWLMMPEEMEENPIINLHETEKAIS